MSRLPDFPIFPASALCCRWRSRSKSVVQQSAEAGKIGKSGNRDIGALLTNSLSHGTSADERGQEALGSRPGIFTSITNISCQRPALQAGGPWGHSYHSYQCYFTMADRQEGAVEVLSKCCRFIFVS